ncbi:1-phosphofructokinase [Flexilinea flocculi]|uniref:1-phosphofructokinase n=1 Tax=Flexilinea flocculi TaxID=1678840 RepID=A0A0S7BVH6_9CHLR|nr:1-phosphofructokinase [Flexilinea flocculi]GAP41505.1 fructose-1-phosphate kinase [Flexilinea flocculi]
MIFTVTLNPAIDKTVTIDNFRIGDVNRITTSRIDAGGKGINVSRVINQLGGKSIALGILGKNGASTIQNALDISGIDHYFVLIDGDVRVNLKIIDCQNHTNTDINEAGISVSNEQLADIFDQIQVRMKPDDIVVLTGSLPPGTDPSLYRQWTEMLQRRGTRVFLDADRTPFQMGIESAPFFIKPNRFELEQLCHTTLPSLDHIIAEGKKLLNTGIKVILVSLGAEGALLLTEDQIIRVEGIRVKPQSTVGAGDAMLASFAISLEQHQSYLEAARLASAVSTAKVLCPGSNPPDPAVIRQLLTQTIVYDYSKRITLER